MRWGKNKKDEEEEVITVWTRTGKEVSIRDIEGFRNEARSLAPECNTWLRSFQEVILRENDAISDYIHHKGFGNFSYTLSDIPFDEPLFSIIPSQQKVRPAKVDNDDDGIPSKDLISLFDQHVIRYHLLLMQLNDAVEAVRGHAGSVSDRLSSLCHYYEEDNAVKGKHYSVTYCLRQVVETCANLHSSGDVLDLAFEKTVLERTNFQSALKAEIERLESELSKQQEQQQAADIVAQREEEEQLDLTREMPTLEVPKQKNTCHPNWKELSLTKLRTMGMGMKISAKHNPVHYANALAHLHSLMIVSQNAVENLLVEQKVLFLQPHENDLKNPYFVALANNGEMPDREKWNLPRHLMDFDADFDIEPVRLHDRNARKAQHHGYTHTVNATSTVAPPKVPIATVLALGTIFI